MFHTSESPLSSPPSSGDEDESNMPSASKRTKSIPKFSPVVQRSRDSVGHVMRGRLPTEIHEVIDLTKERVSLQTC